MVMLDFGTTVKTDDYTGTPTEPTARYFDYARTRAFTLAEAEDHAIYREAHEHPQTGKWYLTEVTIKPNPRKTSSGNQPEFVEDSQYIRSKRELSLPEALTELGKFERTSEMAQMIETGESTAELGEEHFSFVAEHEQIALDIEGKAHPTIEGRITSEGKFDPATRKKLKAARENPPAEQKHRSVPEISGLFNNSGKIQDFDSYLDKFEELVQWREFMKTLKKPLRTLIHIQDQNFRWQESKGFITKYEVEDADDFEKAIKNVRSGLKNNAFMNSDLHEKCSRYLQTLELTFYVGLAKSCFKRLGNLENGSEADLYRGRLNHARDMAATTLQDMGGTATDIEAMKAEIVTSPSARTLNSHDIDRWRQQQETENSNDSKTAKAIKLHENLERHEMPCRYGVTIYYLPDSLFSFLDDIKDIEKDFERVVERQKAGLSHERAKPENDNQAGEPMPQAPETPNP